MKLRRFVRGFRERSVLFVFLLSVVLATNASAYTFTASDSGLGLAASAEFIVSDSILTVTLTNTSTSDVLIPSRILTALFFDVQGVGALTPISAVLGTGSVVWFGPDGGGNVGGEWAYESAINAPHAATEGISSAGYGIFGGANFNGSNLHDPVAIDGGNYGITSAGDNDITGNKDVTGGLPLIKNQVVFTLGIPTGDTVTGITNVSFQYGTSLTDPNVYVPIPAAAWLLGSGLIGLVAVRRRFTKK